MHRSALKTTRLIARTFGLCAVFVGVSSASSSKARALPLQFDFPDSQSVLGPSELIPKNLEDAPAQFANRAILAPLSNDSNVLTMPLQKYRTPSEAVLLREVGLDKSPQVDAAVEKAMSWVTQSMSASERSEFAANCEQYFSSISKGMQLTHSSLACLPWSIERFNQVVAARRENKATRPLAGGRVRSETDWRSSLRGAGFIDAFWRIDPQTTQELLTESLVAQRIGADCQYRGAMAALIARAEAFFLILQPSLQLKESIRRRLRVLNPTMMVSSALTCVQAYFV